mgnify:FL=1
MGIQTRRYTQAWRVNNMTIQELETKLKEIDKNIVINDLSQYGVTDVVEIAYNYNGKMVNICACPSKEVKEEFDPNYKDEYGRPHRTVGAVLSMAQNFMNLWNNEPGFIELMTCNEKDL